MAYPIKIALNTLLADWFKLTKMEYQDLFIFPDNHPPSPYDSPVMRKSGRYGFLPHGLSLCAIGWLEKPGFPTGKVADECIDALFFAKENQIFNDGTRGIHFCTLCARNTNSDNLFGVQVINWREQTINISGHGHYLIQMGKVVYITPRLLLHYILGHNYCPPQEFVQATIHGKFFTEDDLETR